MRRWFWIIVGFFLSAWACTNAQPPPSAPNLPRLVAPDPPGGRYPVRTFPKVVCHRVPLEVPPTPEHEICVP